MKNKLESIMKIFFLGLMVCGCLSLSACYMGFAPKSNPCTIDPDDKGVKLCDAETIRLHREEMNKR